MTNPVDIPKRVEEIIKETGITAGIYQLLMQSVSNYYYKGIDNIENAFQINFDSVNPRVLNFIKEYNFDLVKDMNTELANKLRDTINRNILTGDRKQMVSEIKDIFDTTLTRAKAIARTETARAYAVGEFVGAKEAEKRGIKVRKYWMAVIDDRTSPLCIRLSKKYNRERAIPIDKEFIDIESNWRGYTNPAHSNCRSTVVYVSVD